MKNIDVKYKELRKLEVTIEKMRDKLNSTLMKTLDPLNDEVLALSKELDEIICKYTALKLELKEH